MKPGQHRDSPDHDSPRPSNLDAKIKADLQRAETERARQKLMKYLQSRPQYEQVYNDAREKFQSSINQANNIDTAGVVNKDPELARHLRSMGVEERHLKIIDDMYKKKALRPQERDFGRVGTALLRGKLGIDTLFLAFGITGMFLLPAYFHLKRKRHQKEITTLRSTYEKPESLQSQDIDDTSFDLYSYDREAARKNALLTVKADRRRKALQAEAFDDSDDREN